MQVHRTFASLGPRLPDLSLLAKAAVRPVCLASAALLSVPLCEFAVRAVTAHHAQRHGRRKAVCLRQNPPVGEPRTPQEPGVSPGPW